LVRNALLTDYLASGARSNPQALQGLLPRREKAGPLKPGAAHSKALAQRQSRHQTAEAAAGIAESLFDTGSKIGP
jgi:hypothetical protein